jgi:hypothetical protein
VSSVSRAVASSSHIGHDSVPVPGVGYDVPRTFIEAFGSDLEPSGELRHESRKHLLERSDLGGIVVDVALDSERQMQRADLLAAGVRPDDLYIDHGVSGARALRPEFDRAFDARIQGDTLVIATLDRLGRFTQNMLAFADELCGRDPLACAC